jgi:hypothetical protein
LLAVRTDILQGRFYTAKTSTDMAWRPHFGLNQLSLNIDLKNALTDSFAAFAASGS